MIKNLNNKRKIITSRLNYYFSKKSALIIYLLLLIGTIIPALSGTITYNFWWKFTKILTSSIYYSMLFISIFISIIYIRKEFSLNYNIVNRKYSYKRIINEYVKDIVLVSVYLLFVSLLLAFSFAFMFTIGDWNNIFHEIYNIPISIYLIFFIIRCFAFVCIINIIMYLLSLLLKKPIYLIVVLLNSFLFMLLPDINTIKYMLILPHYYFRILPFPNFLIEIVYSILELFLLLLIYKIIYKIVIKKKRDLL